jgi:hypothetical protein
MSQSSARAFKSSICRADFSAKFNEMCLATTSTINPRLGKERRVNTYGFDVDWTMWDDDICGVGLLVDVIFVGRFYKRKVLLKDAFEVAATFVDIAD